LEGTTADINKSSMVLLLIPTADIDSMRSPAILVADDKPPVLLFAVNEHSLRPALM